MKLFCLLSFLLLISNPASSQTSFAWERPLIICTSQDGINFSACSQFEDSSGVPSMAMDSSGRLLSAFQWFPAPFQGPDWDSVAVKISLDSGQTWTTPFPIEVQNLPVNFQRPFDPTLVALPGGQIRIYFSSGPPGMNTIGTYSAIGTDGIHYTFESGVRFSQVGRNCIDPAVIIHQGVFHYTSPKGAPQDGAFHAVSNDGLNFTQLADIVSDAQHNWTGNMMVDSLAIKFYGCGGPSMWFSATGNGNQWSPYQPLNIPGGDPAIVKIPGKKFILIYTGTPNITGIANEFLKDRINLYPNPAQEVLNVSGINPMDNNKFTIVDMFGRIHFEGVASEETLRIPVRTLTSGIYIFELVTNDAAVQRSFQVLKY